MYRPVAGDETRGDTALVRDDARYGIAQRTGEGDGDQVGLRSGPEFPRRPARPSARRHDRGETKGIRWGQRLHRGRSSRSSAKSDRAGVGGPGPKGWEAETAGSEAVHRRGLRVPPGESGDAQRARCWLFGQCTTWVPERLPFRHPRARGS